MKLSELSSLVRSAINDALPDMYWIVAEIADAKCNQKGHCYMELVEKEDHKTIAQMRATIWAYEYRTLSRKFEAAAKTPLKQGIKVLLLVAVSFHEVYGLSLNVKDIDPAYTAGEMALRRREIIERLRREGIIDTNKELELPLVPQRIAVISSPTAAGYGDFMDQLRKNAFGYWFGIKLFPALMQGPETEQSVIAALARIEKIKSNFDIVVIIRGGGSVADLSTFDNYAIAAKIAMCPLPVITGIGHEKDDTVADLVAHTKMKTPTAVAEFLISGARAFEDNLTTLENRMRVYTEKLLGDSASLLNSLSKRLAVVPSHITVSSGNRISALEKNLNGYFKQYMQHKQNRLTSIEQAIRHLDPANVLRRGYSITRHSGKILKDSELLSNGDIIETELSSGKIKSIVDNKETSNGAE
jgi:exodeoxyribonuclease VII large subunit